MACTARAMAPLSATGRARSVDPVMVRRRCMIVGMVISAFAPRRVAISTRRPSTASASILRPKYSPPTMSRTRSTPRPPVRSRIAVEEVGLAIVDRALGPEALAGGAFLRRSGRREHACAAGPCELDRGRADAARAAVNQDRLAGGEPTAFEDIGPDREKGFRDRCRGDQVQAARRRQALRRRRDAVFGIAPARDERADRVAGAPAGHVLADALNRSRHLESGNIRRAGRRRVSAHALHHVGPIHARRDHFDEDLAGRRDRTRPLRRHEDVRISRFSNLDGDHLLHWRRGPTPARTDADTSPRISMSSARYGRRRFCTGGGAPPPARTDADTSPRISMSSARCGRRRFCTGAGAPPPAPQRGSRVGDPAPARTDADTSPRISMSSARCGRRRFCTGAGAPPPAPQRGCRVDPPRRELTLTPRLGFPCPRLGVAAGAFALAPGPHRLHPNAAPALGTPPRRELTLTPRLGFPCPRLGVAAGAFALAPGPHRLHPNAAAALGTPPRRELTLTLRCGFAWPRRSVAAGAAVK